MATLTIRMLDGFSIQFGEKSIDDRKSRTRKTWLLLAYLLYYRSRPVSQEELYQLLWGDEESKDDPQNALRVTLHRSRALLEPLELPAGTNLILRQKDGYRWNPDVSVWLDVEDFESLCRAGLEETDPEKQLLLFRQALALYRADFLYRQSVESMVRTLSLHLHDLYLEIVRRQIALLEERSLWEECVEVCRAALNVEPFSENLYFHLLQGLLALNRQSEAISAYEQARELFAENFGTLPAEELRRLYYEAIQDVHDHTIPIEELYENLSVDEADNGALLCDYDFFKAIFLSTVRQISRSGLTAHLVLLTVTGKDGESLPKRSRDYIMDSVLEQIRSNLRRGDIVTRSSISQYAVLLQMANYENSCMICQRIIRAYGRKYPHSPAELKVSIQTVEGEA